ncbi:hypothetical protein UFOVP239_15 [uncultured Caudovirales phage]|uniref:Uncharacterized protein n=1 Tax=uncultured Caudovirales phage TaxID=2100421 RepID=A0A6J7WPN4_9CAUD|nr:hypothetical protein UFOVP239_15 [uncultured Caudovirales phage]
MDKQQIAEMMGDRKGCPEWLMAVAFTAFCALIVFLPGL